MGMYFKCKLSFEVLLEVKSVIKIQILPMFAADVLICLINTFNTFEILVFYFVLNEFGCLA